MFTGRRVQCCQIVVVNRLCRDLSDRWRHTICLISLGKKPVLIRCSYCNPVVACNVQSRCSDDRNVRTFYSINYTARTRNHYCDQNQRFIATRNQDKSMCSQPDLNNPSPANYDLGSRFLIDSLHKNRSLEKAPAWNSRQAGRPSYKAKTTPMSWSNVEGEHVARPADDDIGTGADIPVTRSSPDVAASARLKPYSRVSSSSRSRRTRLVEWTTLTDTAVMRYAIVCVPVLRKSNGIEKTARRKPRRHFHTSR